MKFQCLHCNQHYEIDEKFAGASVHCKSCGNITANPYCFGNSRLRRGSYRVFCSKEDAKAVFGLAQLKENKYKETYK